jgi:two-component system OmpR family response regulator
MLRVLIVEDERKMRDLLRQGLLEAGFGVDAVGTGDEALALRATKSWDVILLDVMLPGLDGFETCRRLRALGAIEPILMLTARSAVEDRVRGLDTGADDYLTKPFSLQELLARIRALARRPPVEPQVTLRVADLELDPASHEVRRAGRLVELTAKEFTLLAFLMRHAGQVVTPRMILAHAWDFDHARGSNVVAVYINYLRRKIDQDHDVKLIHTVRGSGYVLRTTEP